MPHLRGGVLHRLEDDHEEILCALDLAYRADGQADSLFAPVRLHEDRPPRDGALLLESGAGGGGKRIAETLPRHRMDVQGGSARMGFKILPGPPLEVQDVAVLVHDHRRRGILRE